MYSRYVDTYAYQTAARKRYLTIPTGYGTPTMINTTLAWALCNSGLDLIDLFLHTSANLSPHQPHTGRVDWQVWEPRLVHEETADRTVTLPSPREISSCNCCLLSAASFLEACHSLPVSFLVIAPVFPVRAAPSCPAICPPSFEIDLPYRLQSRRSISPAPSRETRTYAPGRSSGYRSLSACLSVQCLPDPTILCILHMCFVQPWRILVPF